MDKASDIISFYKGKKVFITGHTGFKGTYLTKLLVDAGASVTGYSLNPPTSPSLFELIGLEDEMESVIGDIRDMDKLWEAFEKADPEIVFHLAAQPLVRYSYEEPRLTYETNVMGTVNMLECVRRTPSVRSFLNVTTDKVYENNDLDMAFSEDMPLDGYDPYSNSKSCSELVTHSYKKSFFSSPQSPAISTARAGNVIGGGDFALDRIVPDCVRAAEKGENIVLRNPQAIRPYQHVLEPLLIYLEIAKSTFESKEKEGYYNVGPDISDCISTGDIATKFAESWGKGMEVMVKRDDGPHEASFLKLDCRKLKDVFGWRSVWNIDEAIKKTVEMSRVYIEKGDLKKEMERQIAAYIKAANDKW
ncbi:MAG: CDP-glucose 4,6-dehydratase [Lachnospiraceae bacterium]|nr:CDP-glucose 4,6-dehydratase [Lachnospiraceae bacterium]